MSLNDTLGHLIFTTTLWRLLPQFYRWGKWGSEVSKVLCKVTSQISKICVTLNPFLFCHYISGLEKIFNDWKIHTHTHKESNVSLSSWLSQKQTQLAASLPFLTQPYFSLLEQSTPIIMLFHLRRHLQTLSSLSS